MSLTEPAYLDANQSQWILSQLSSPRTEDFYSILPTRLRSSGRLSTPKTPMVSLNGRTRVPKELALPHFINFIAWYADFIKTLTSADSTVQDALRRGYYQREDTIAALRKSEEEPEFEHEVDEIHMLHCIEFLRQSVMCHADTTVQTEAEYHQGILAFGVEYQCKNWWQLVDWVDRRNQNFPSQKS
jgi:hypothetical protein